MSEIIIYTDGGTRGNGKDNAIGGWGVYIQFNGKTREFKGYKKGTTNQRMELEAVAVALEKINSDKYSIYIHSDSAYIVNCMNDGWYKKWRVNGWKNAKKEPVANKDLWERILNAYDTKKCEVKFIKVKGHSGIEGNEIADRLCNEAMDECENIMNRTENPPDMIEIDKNKFDRLIRICSMALLILKDKNTASFNGQTIEEIEDFVEQVYQESL